MDGPHVTEALPGYCLGILDEAEARQIREHLATCDFCQKELLAFRTVVGQLPLAVTQVDPRPQVKTALFERIQVSRPEPRETAGQRFVHFFRRSAPAFAVVSFLLALALLITNLLLWRQVRQLAAAPLDQFHVVQLASAEPGMQAYAWMVMTPDGRYGTLIVEGLPDLEESQTYQLWLIRGEERISGGMFTVNWGGYSAMEIHAPQDLVDYDLVGVTIEPAGGSPAPTGPRVLTGDL